MPPKFDLSKRARIVRICGYTILGAIIAGVIALDLVVIPRMPEFLIARNYIEKSPAVNKEFGEVLNIERSRIFRFAISSELQYSRNGYFGFKVNGRNDSGIVKLHWRSKPDAQAFEVTRLVRADTASKPRELVLP